MTAREAILGALPADRQSQLPDLWPSPERSDDDLWRIFEERFLALGGEIGTMEMARKLLPGAWLDADAAALIDVPETTGSLWECEVGFTTALLAVAETATLVVDSGPGKRRLASLAPPTHVVLIDSDAIDFTLESAAQRLSARNTVWISGTSRTADIEGVLVRGVHGPRRVILVRL